MSSFGFGYQGGHPESKGVSATGQVVPTPFHKHEVSLDFVQFEVGLALAFNERWELRLRLPYAIKRQRAKIRFVEDVNEAERAAIIRNQDVHHRSETYEGLSDPMLLLARTFQGLFWDDALTVSVGLSIPVGQTERDPFLAGDEGREHLHIQFGSGTFDPLIELQYQVQLNPFLSVQVFSSGRWPLTYNRKDFRAAAELSTSASLLFSASEPVSVYSGYLLFMQGYGHWRKTGRDENTGLVSHNAVGGLLLLFGELSVNIELRLPLTQRTLSGRGDTFEQRPSYVFAISHQF